MTLDELSRKIGAELVGDPSLEITSANTLDEASAGQVSFLSNPKYLRQLETTKASAVVVSPRTTNGRVALLKAKDPYYAFTQAMILLHGHRKHPHQGVHPLAHVDPTARVGASSVLYPGVYVGPRARVGEGCILYPNAVVYDNCVLGNRVTIHAGSVVGVDGFGYATHGGVHHKIPQAGNVIIEDDVEIGANVAIERATLGSTIIGKGTKFADLIGIGHGTKIGAHGLLVSQVGIAGSVHVGDHVTMGGQVGVAGHLRIGDHVTIAAQSGIVNNVEDDSILMGAPAMPAHHARRVYTVFTKLPDLLDRIKELEQRVKELSSD